MPVCLCVFVYLPPRLQELAELHREVADQHGAIMNEHKKEAAEYLDSKSIVRRKKGMKKKKKKIEKEESADADKAANKRKVKKGSFGAELFDKELETLETHSEATLQSSATPHFYGGETEVGRIHREIEETKKKENAKDNLKKLGEYEIATNDFRTKIHPDSLLGPLR